MSRKRKLPNLKERCRICLAEHGCMSNLFDEILQSKIKNLTKCTSIDIKDENGLPNNICHVCFYKVDTWNEFKDQFIRSNQILLNQLENLESSDNTVSQSKRAHTDLEKSVENTPSDNPDKKKSGTEASPTRPPKLANEDSITNEKPVKELYISEDDPASSKDSSQKLPDISNDDKCKNDNENDNESHDQLKPSLVPVKVKSLTGRRGRTTERRKASTKRWVARKKALLAATGENVSDTDSIESDDTELSPVQKARAKTNADKEAERQKRLANELKKLETNMITRYSNKDDSDNFLCGDTDSDIRRTRSRKDLNSDTSQSENKSTSTKECGNENNEKTTKLSSRKDSKGKDNSPISLTEKTLTNNFNNSSEIQIAEDTFMPRSVKSQLEVGNATYIVTSTLILAEPHYLNKENLNTMSKDLKNGNIDQCFQEKNTDIIDAVQLRRINPIPTDSNKKCVEKCLNIEVEGTEIEALKRVQVGLAAFVEKEMKHRLFGPNTSDKKKEKTENVCKNSYQTLDQQLKHIVEKTIKKNFESSMSRTCGPGAGLCNRKCGTVSPLFVKDAMSSKKYQPKVILKRLDVAKESKHQKINNVHAVNKNTSKNRLGGPFSMVAHKRQSVPPLRYNDYNTSALDSYSSMSEDLETSETSRAESSRNIKQPQTVIKESKADTTKEVEQSPSKTIARNSGIKEQRVETRENLPQVEPPVVEKHLCGVCHQSFNSRNEVAAHVRMHKTDNTVPRHNKHKMMRCKRCHEIVEARFVKAHVCKSTKQVHKCYVCDSTFRTEKLLARHLESHDQSEFNIEHITKGEHKKPNGASSSQNAKDVTLLKSGKDQLLDNPRTVMINGQSEKVGIVKGTKSDNIKAMEKPKETYTCFVCDKIFTDEEVLKDHLQKHCDDMSEDEQSNGKEQYQCAICGDSMDSEDALEAHVEKHLFDEEDDNPNLISIANENEKPKENSYHCLQCAEVFNSEMLLEMHMQAHEEEAAIAEWEKQGIKSYEFQCMICDELFETEEELSEHLDVHNGNAHVCQLCEKPFSSLEDLQKHVATH